MICFETEEQLAVVIKYALNVKEEEAQIIAGKIFDQCKKIKTVREIFKSKLGAKVSPQEIKLIDEYKKAALQRKRKKKGPKKTSIQIKYLGLVHKLREEGFSWTQISDYLAKYHKIRIHYSSIKRYYDEAIETIKDARD